MPRNGKGWYIVDNFDYSQYIEEFKRTLATISFHPHVVKKVFDNFNIPESQHVKLQNLLGITVAKSVNSIEDGELFRQDRVLSVAMFGIVKMIDATTESDIVRFVERHKTPLT